MTPSAASFGAEIRRRADPGRRLIVAIAGPPGSGKSTLSEALLDELPGAVLVPMDGFHLDNGVLEARGLLGRKGAPETFDVEGLLSCLRRIRAGSSEVLVPVFDRRLDLARAGARTVGPGHGIVLVEGNYLLVDGAPWADLADLFDLTIAVEVTAAVLRQRLIDRWLEYGLPPERATSRADGNDMINARYVAEYSRRADLVCRQ